MASLPVEEISITEFKAKCLAILARVNESGTRIIVTKRGKPIAEITPPKRPSAHWGFGKGTIKTTGDIIAPLPREAWGRLG